MFQVLEVTVPTLDAYRVRRGVAGCQGAGVLRCEPVLHASASCTDCRMRVRLSIRLPSSSYAAVIHCLIENSDDGEVGRLLSWSQHIAHRA